MVDQVKMIKSLLIIMIILLSSAIKMIYLYEPCSLFFIYTKFYSQKSEWDWEAGIAYFNPLPTARSRLYTLYKYNT